MESFTYNGEPAAYSGEAVVTIGAENGEVITQKVGALAYHYSGTQKDGTVYEESTKAPVDAGNYILTVAIAEDNEKYMGLKNYPFEIRKAPVTITAENQTIAVGDVLPETFGYTAEGLLNGNTFIKEPLFSCNADTSREGS